MCRGSEHSDTPLFRGSHLPGVWGAVGEEGWGKPELARGKPPDLKRRGRWKGDQGEFGRGAGAPTCSGVCWQRGDGVPRRTGEALSAQFRIPPASGLDCCKRHRFPLGPKAHSANSRFSRLLPPALTGSRGAALRTDGGGRTP